MDKDQTTTPGTTCPTLYDECVGSLTSPASQEPLNKETEKDSNIDVTNRLMLFFQLQDSVINSAISVMQKLNKNQSTLHL